MAQEAALWGRGSSKPPAPHAEHFDRPPEAAPRARGSSKPRVSHAEHLERPAEAAQHDVDGHSYHIVVTQEPEGHEESGDDGGDLHMYDPHGRTDSIKRSFLAKTLDAPVQSSNAPIFRSPANSEVAATSVAAGVVPPRPARKRSKKKRHKDIFRAFGREHDMHAMLEVEVGGVIRQRTNYARCWENEEDLGRWHEALGKESRHGRLLWDVKSKWHHDIAADTLELKERHNGFFRGTSPKAHREDPAIQLKELQRKLSPKESKKKKDSAKYEILLGFAGKRGQGEGSLGPVRSSLGFEDQAPGLELIASQRSQRSPSKASSDVRSDIRSLRANSRLDAVSEGANTSMQGSRAGSRRPSGSSCGTAAERERLAAEAEGTEPDTDDSDATPRAFYGSKSRMPNMPTTMRFMLFRNADKLHAGTAAFIKKWPPASMAELLVACGHVSRPVVPPAEALYTEDMRLIRSPDEVVPGCVYLLKGKEPLDPPHNFFQDASMSQHSFGDGRASPAHTGSQRLQGVSAQSFGPRVPTVGSPPSPAELALSDAYRGLGSKAWGVDRRLGMILSWGGLSSPPHRHHDFRSWPSALAASGRGSLASVGGSRASSGSGSASAPQLMRMTR